jgi:hypothetical protein
MSFRGQWSRVMDGWRRVRLRRPSPDVTSGGEKSPWARIQWLRHEAPRLSGPRINLWSGAHRIEFVCLYCNIRLFQFFDLYQAETLTVPRAPPFSGLSLSLPPHPILSPWHPAPGRHWGPVLFTIRSDYNQYTAAARLRRLWLRSLIGINSVTVADQPSGSTYTRTYTHILLVSVRL